MTPLCARCGALLRLDTTSLRDAASYGVPRARAVCPMGHSEYVAVDLPPTWQRVIPASRMGPITLTSVRRATARPVTPARPCRECSKPLSGKWASQRRHHACAVEYTRRKALERWHAKPVTTRRKATGQWSLADKQA